MTWYGASLLFAAKTGDKEQEKFSIEEEVYLVNAENDEIAWKIAKNIGRDDAKINNTTELDGKIVERKFVGIRKLRSIYNPDHMDDIDQEAPTHGSEITRSKFEVTGRTNLLKLTSGKSVTVSYVDGAI